MQAKSWRQLHLKDGEERIIFSMHEPVNKASGVQLWLKGEVAQGENMYRFLGGGQWPCHLVRGLEWKGLKDWRQGGLDRCSGDGAWTFFFHINIYHGRNAEYLSRQNEQPDRKKQTDLVDMSQPLLSVTPAWHFAHINRWAQLHGYPLTTTTSSRCLGICNLTVIVSSEETSLRSRWLQWFFSQG